MMKPITGAVRCVDKEEVLLEKAGDIIVAGDPGCTGFDDQSRRILGGIFAKKADAFIILGDLVHRGNADELIAFLSFCNTTARVPVFTLCGNHDLPGYPPLLGRSTYMLVAGALVFLFIDNVTDRQHFNPRDLDFVGRALDKYPDKKFIVLFHIPPPTDVSPKHMDGQKWAELKTVLDAHKDRIECIMCGHVHGFADYVKDGYRIFITGGGGAKLEDLEKDTVRSHHAINIKTDLSGLVGFEVIGI